MDPSTSLRSNMLRPYSVKHYFSSVQASNFSPNEQSLSVNLLQGLIEINLTLLHSPSLLTVVRCVIKGRVQGVFYRNWTIENASQLGIKGWVRNRRDGSVEALFSGNTEAVDEMMQRCRRGPPDAMVTAFQAHPCNEDPGISFERRPTV
ncbi:hypothetical protein KSS87_014249 [Heliosperma pusillum]|nr:hypothetical protein KSS87_005916 [Heliosperma pusillum]KAH9624684.1 hypothetical protein KSS87_014249 [Heliosperma pusillum]